MTVYSFVLLFPFFTCFSNIIIQKISIAIIDFLYVFMPIFIILGFVLLIVHKFCKKPIVEDLFTFSLLNIFASMIFDKLRYIIDNDMYNIPVSITIIFVAVILIIMYLYQKNLFKYTVYVFLSMILSMFAMLMIYGL